MPSKEKRLKDAKAAAFESDIRVLRTMMDVTIPRVSLCSTLGYEPLAPLGHSTLQVVLLLFSGYAAVKRQRLDGEAVIRQLRCG